MLNKQYHEDTNSWFEGHHFLDKLQRELELLLPETWRNDIFTVCCSFFSFCILALHFLLEMKRRMLPWQWSQKTEVYAWVTVWSLIRKGRRHVQHLYGETFIPLFEAILSSFHILMHVRNIIVRRSEHSWVHSIWLSTVK